MAIPFLNSVDLTKNEILNAIFQKLTTAPINPLEGQFYYNTIDKEFCYYNGTDWISGVGTDIIDNLVSERTDAALSAKQGKVLKILVDNLQNSAIEEVESLPIITNENKNKIIKYEGILYITKMSTLGVLGWVPIYNEIAIQDEEPMYGEKLWIDDYQVEAQELLVNDTLPIGCQMPYSSANVPENWLRCDGSAVSRTEYVELFAVIGTNYGVGDGSTTFNLPDKRKRTSVGLDTTDTDFNAIGKKLGEKEHTLTTDELPSNIGTFRALAWSNGSDNTTGMFSKEIIANDRWADPGTDFGTRKYSLSGGNQPHNNMQPSEVDNWIIKAKQTIPIVSKVIDSLTSTSETDALSANQGRILKNLINEIKLEIKSEEHPVGSLEFNVNGVNPSTYLGGTWEAWGSGRVPVGVWPGDTDFNEVEKLGGSKTHSLTEYEVPGTFWHTDTLTGDNLDLSFNPAFDYGIRSNTSKHTGNAFSIVQPYITCYMWKRIA